MNSLKYHHNSIFQDTFRSLSVILTSLLVATAAVTEPVDAVEKKSQKGKINRESVLRCVQIL